MSAVGLMLRRGRRVAIRSPWRTIWTGALVALPVAVCVVMLSAAWGHHVRAGSAERGFGRAAAVYSASSLTAGQVDQVTDAIASSLLPGIRTSAVDTASGFTVTREAPSGGPASGGLHDASGGIDAQMADWGDPILQGILSLTVGRAPGAGEAVVSPTIAQRLGVDVGDRIGILDADASLKVVGIGTAGYTADGLVLAAGELVPAPASTPFVSSAVYVEAPAGSELPKASAVMAAAGLDEGSGITGPQLRDQADQRRVETYDPSRSSRSAYFATTTPTGVLAGLAATSVLVVGVVAGAAFGLGSRRRLRAAGLMSANGANSGQLVTAAAAEAEVVAGPAALVGLGAALVVPDVWVRFRLPGWTSLVDAVVPWLWAVLVVVAAVVAAALGAVVFSRSLRNTPASSLLDDRPAASAARSEPQRIGVLAVVGFGALAYVAGSALIFVVGARPMALGGIAAIAVLVLWAACAVAALWLLRFVLDRDPVGRLIDRDLRRHRLGSTAVVIVVATWVFVAVGGTATDRFSSISTEDGVTTTYLEDSDPTSLQHTNLTPTTAPFPGSSVVAPEGATTPAVATGPTEGGIVLTGPHAGGVASSSTGWAQRGSEAGDTSSDPSASRESAPAPLPEGTAARLAEAGLVTSPALVGSYTGPCAVCPNGFVPSVLVLEQADGVGLAPATVDLLNSGVAVTPFDIDGIDSQLVAGVPVRVGSVPSGFSAVVLGSSMRNGSQLTDPRPALVANSSGLDATEVASVIDVVRDEDLTVTSWDPRIDPMTWEGSGGWTIADGSGGWSAWPWLAVLVAVTLAATAAHRREHGDAGRVLWMLGAGPKASRRLSSLTAFSLAGVGVAMGLTAVLVVLSIEAMRVTRSDPFTGLWNREASLLLVASLAVPVVVGLLAWLVPAASGDRGPDGPAPL